MKKSAQVTLGLLASLALSHPMGCAPDNPPPVEREEDKQAEHRPVGGGGHPIFIPHSSSPPVSGGSGISSHPTSSPKSGGVGHTSSGVSRGGFGGTGAGIGGAS